MRKQPLREPHHVNGAAAGRSTPTSLLSHSPASSKSSPLAKAAGPGLESPEPSPGHRGRVGRAESGFQWWGRARSVPSTSRLSALIRGSCLGAIFLVFSSTPPSVPGRKALTEWV